MIRYYTVGNSCENCKMIHKSLIGKITSMTCEMILNFVRGKLCIKTWITLVKPAEMDISPKFTFIT